MERIKLIWDFRSIDAEKIATHHVKHLQQYITAKDLQKSTASEQKISDAYWTAFIETDKSNMIQLRDDLKPHRGEII
tara:strand:- start:4866 stop:5096 length:231 start_codon:yes stop_codon:yes gene_type:complete